MLASVIDLIVNEGKAVIKRSHHKFYFLFIFHAIGESTAFWVASHYEFISEVVEYVLCDGGNSGGSGESEFLEGSVVESKYIGEGPEFKDNYFWSI
jgi:hypothetical protein